MRKANRSRIMCVIMHTIAMAVIIAGFVVLSIGNGSDSTTLIFALSFLVAAFILYCESRIDKKQDK